MLPDIRDYDELYRRFRWQVPPEYNRLVIVTLGDDHVHSVTPSRGRVRDGFLQWLF